MKQSMILLHGLFGGLSNWAGVVKYFENRYDMYIPELPLYEKHEGDTVRYLVDFLATMIDAAKLTKVILVGNSLGGHIAIRYSYQYPHKVDRLVLTGSSGLYENTQVGSYFKRGNYGYIRERVAATFYDPAVATDDLVAEVLEVTTNAYKCLSIIKCAKSTQRDRVLTLLPEINKPVLLIWGEEDSITPPAVARQFRENLPDAALVMLPECGHAPMMEKPAAFNAALQEFIK
ncbi:alpha/beta fold hydrolase [Mucilaginibacter sp. OK283]|uniref:alpha/beta fold hydrolase n=1 Tax=Mucilaginibacter sp. OK283 TaxID=1881049 RepID=UPI0008B7F4D7|nr:alpha/beta hydrolase [Mucilaginibacter sp. OK283]SEO05545.1 Pimeloyl-ACP methyl ester carboxylesterase [Mucilaginibacter sp. OK283]